MKQRKVLRADIDDSKCVNDDEMKKGLVTDVSSNNENLREVIVPDNCPNKSISSEASTKNPDSIIYNSSSSDQSDTVSTDLVLMMTNIP